MSHIGIAVGIALCATAGIGGIGALASEREEAPREEAPVDLLGGGGEKGGKEHAAQAEVRHDGKAAHAHDDHQGVARGVVVEIGHDKGAIVLRDGDGKVRAFVPRWIGGMPADGGGLDKEAIVAARRLKPGDEVEVQWFHDERPRHVSVKVLSQAPSEGADIGVIRELNRDDGTIVLRTLEGEQRYVPHWRGGMPKDGGGPDRDTIRKVAQFKEGAVVVVQWRWAERRRIEDIRIANATEQRKFAKLAEERMRAEKAEREEAMRRERERDGARHAEEREAERRR